MTFHDSVTADMHTAGFVTPASAVSVISSLVGPTSSAPRTPLAGGACDAVDALVAAASPGLRILYLGSDGLENNTPASHPCFGPSSTSDVPPYTSGSWQNHVYSSAVSNVVVQVDLFNFADITSLMLAPFDMEKQMPILGSMKQLTPTLDQFMTALAEDSGGTITIASDDDPLPVLGDYDGDGCVTAADATGLIQSMGLTVPPANAEYDINSDGIIDFEDYIAWSSTIGNGCS